MTSNSLMRPPVLSRFTNPAERAVRVLKRRASQGPFQGYLDGISHDGLIRGWVVDRASRRGGIKVGLYAGGRLLEAVIANVPRGDVRDLTQSDVLCGFELPLSETLLKRMRKAGGPYEMRPVSKPRHVIGTLDIASQQGEPTHPAEQIAACRTVLGDDLNALLDLLADLPDRMADLPPAYPPKMPLHETLFSTAPIMPEAPQSGQIAYMDSARFRMRLDTVFPVEDGVETGDRYLHWYISNYRRNAKMRTPLGREAIEYLNAPLVMGAQKFTLSRIMWWRMTSRPELMANLNLDEHSEYLKLLYWWAWHESAMLYYEDCLVPERFADVLRGVRYEHRLDDYPLSAFMQLFLEETPALQFLKTGSAADRKLLALVLLVKSARRPDLLRYLPQRVIKDLLEADATGQSALSAFISELTGRPVPIGRARFTAALRKVAFDVPSYRFMTFDASGNRLAAAAMPRPDDAPEGARAPEVDVQLIGPLMKTSGLGQATRLSADILRATGLAMRAVDYDLDNPAPVGFSSETEIDEYGPAKINLIHLNAESIPLAFAYQPDVFSGRYNIGYFFWELDRPAYCHYLALELLDEIWVSSDYGVEIYTKDAKGKPAVNVGMCYEETPEISRDEARDLLRERFLIEDGCFVCLVAFDSYSFTQRKNPLGAIEAFQAAFDGVENVRLILKTQNRGNVFDPVQLQHWDRIDAFIASDPRIVLMNETLSYHDLLRLKAGSDCYMSLHKSEGWGFGMIEAMNLGVPVVCTAYSGNMEFCNDDTAWLVDYEEAALQHGDYIFVRPGSKWVEPDLPHAARQLRAAYDDPDARVAKVDAARTLIRKSFSREAIAERYGARLGEILEKLESSRPSMG
ncbi:glycosyltransferase [Aestuariibius sp. 2305UL40-4]|uniref:glycosyltransferase n=1 Tax=Aestuariibius violaceus TaxID=3234132 RepID=UPI00345F0A8C